MHVTIRLFARLREMAGTGELARDVADGATASDAWSLLVREFPSMGDYSRNVACAINEEYAQLTTTLHNGDEVAFLPPVSGGSDSDSANGAGLWGRREPGCRGIWGAKPAGKEINV